MALKDLVADHGKITEEMIEKIISNYVRYDPRSYEIILTPAGAALANDAKVLVILVAILGWQYVVDDAPQVNTKPNALETLTGIPGGTLRPTLKKLKASHLLAVVNGHYSARVANLDAIARTVAGEKTAVPVKRTTVKKGKTGGTRPSAEEQVAKQSNEKGFRKAGVPIRASLERLLDEGFFSDTRTLSEVVGRLHELAIIARSTSLSGPVADLVRNNKLARRKVKCGSKEIWGYKVT